MKTIFNTIILIFLCVLTYGGKIIYVASRTDLHLIAYQDSLTAYNIGKSVCDSLAHLFEQYSQGHDYDSYFLGGWKEGIKFGDEVDTILASTEFQPNTGYPDTLDGNVFQSVAEFGVRVKEQLHRLDSLKVKPYASVSGGEMPTVYIYRRPSVEFAYKKLDKCWLPKRKYSIVDLTTYFIKKDTGLTLIPYNIIKYYENDKCVKTDWVSPVNKEIVLRTFGDIK